VKAWDFEGECSLSAKKLHESYKKATDRRIFISPSTMAKLLGTLSKPFEISVKWLWIQGKNRIPLSPPVIQYNLFVFSYLGKHLGLRAD
jgi:hypothetical protein